MTSLVIALASIAVVLLLFVVGCWKAYSVGFSHGDALSDKEHLEAMLVLEREQKEAVLEARGRIRAARDALKEVKGDEALAGVVAMVGDAGAGPDPARGVPMPEEGTVPSPNDGPAA